MKKIYKINVPDTSNEERLRKLMKISDKLKGIEHQYIKTTVENTIEKISSLKGVKYLWNT